MWRWLFENWGEYARQIGSKEFTSHKFTDLSAVSAVVDVLGIGVVFLVVALVGTY